tara:strand:- start:32 stop:1435 length:1404 start_codon:yes stop_codon:yes gene_type:complete
VGVFGQSPSQTFCFTEPTSKNESLYNSKIRIASVENSYCLKIYVHVIRRSNGTGGQSEQDILEAINILNFDFSAQQISFNLDDNIDYIDNDNYYNIAGSYIFNINSHSDGIDIYLFDDSSSQGGQANGVGNSSEFYVSGSNWQSPYESLVKSSVISHEMGHVLFLWHTHHGCETGNWEATNGTNCWTTGDFVCDTPSDPHLNFNVNINNCEWTKQNNPSCSTPEPIGNYNPDEKIIMAYTHPGCMSYFTDGQGQRMRNAIATLPHLINASDTCDNCDENLTIASTVSGNPPILNEVSNTITSYSRIENNAKVTYSAGNKILLKSGYRNNQNTSFHAKAGSTFIAKIDGCSNVSSRVFTGETIHEDKQKTVNNFDEILNLEAPNELTQNTDFGIKIYPNPTSSNLSIESNTSINSWMLLNPFGHQLKGNTNLNAKKAELNVSGLTTGIYFLKIQLDSGNTIIKRVIKK